MSKKEINGQCRECIEAIFREYPKENYAPDCCDEDSFKRWWARCPRAKAFMTPLMAEGRESYEALKKERG